MLYQFILPSTKLEAKKVNSSILVTYMLPGVRGGYSKRFSLFAEININLFHFFSALFWIFPAFSIFWN